MNLSFAIIGCAGPVAASDREERLPTFVDPFGGDCTSTGLTQKFITYA